MLTKAEEARIANDKARINDLVSTEVLASYGKDGQLDKEQLLTNLKRIPGVEDLPATVEEMVFDEAHPLEFTVDGYKVTVEWNGKVTVGDLGEGESTPTPSDKTLTEITLSIEPKEINVGETATLTATMTPTDADDTLKFTAEPAENVKITTSGTTATIEGVKVGEVTITVSGTKTSSVTAQCTVTVKAVAVAGTEASESTSYVGYYADLDGDLNTVEGIIYADLAVGHESSKWNGDSWSVYQYSKATSGLKKYTVGEEEKTGVFGTHTAPVITKKAGTDGADRFYVMALEDLDSSYHYWWQGGYGKLDTSKVVGNTANDFSADDNESTGKKNTDYWIGKYDDISYRSTQGISDSSGSYTDLWKMDELRTKVNAGWFVPSKSEWSAFGDMCYNFADGKMTTSNYGSFGLSYYYWSSSQGSANYAYRANFFSGDISDDRVNNYDCVRLSTTF